MMLRTVHASPSALALAVAFGAVTLSAGNSAHAQTRDAAPAPAPAPAGSATPPAPGASAPQAPAARPDADTADTPEAAGAPPAAADDEETPAATPAPREVPPAAPGTTTAPPAAVPLWPEPSADAAALERQGDARPERRVALGDAEADRVYAEDWWSHARPILELHGYFRVRAQLFHKFGLGRLDPANQALWPRPADDYYESIGNRGGDARTPTGPAANCTEEEAEVGPSDSATSAEHPCNANMQAGANMRFRLNPELHISDNLRVMSQVDLLDNLVLGSTPSGYNNMPSSEGGYAVAPRSGYAPLGFYDDTQAPPSDGRNAVMDSIRVKRAWAEYTSPVGELRFGRMPFHWGLGMMFNAGDGHDDDYQSTVDRVQAITGIKPLDLYFSAAWDFPNEGITSDAAALPNPEPYDLAQLDDVDQYVFSIARRKAPELERLSLARGELVLNAGIQLVYRQQILANDRSAIYGDASIEDSTGGCAPANAAPFGCPIGYAGTNLYVRRDAHAWIPDLWLELKYKKFRFATEIATVQGSIANISQSSQQSLLDGDPGYDIRAWGFVGEIDQKLAEDRLSLGFKFGWSSGDADVDGLVPGLGGSLTQYDDRVFETFRFHPSYRVDMILGRHILTRQQGTYYFRPSADYDFLRDPNGQRIGGGLAAIWTRASQFIQAPGHERDLGIELNGKLYYQSKDGALNDVPGILGGFFTELQYGVLFPMAGLGYPDQQAADIVSRRGQADAAETRIAQTLRWYMGVLF